MIEFLFELITEVLGDGLLQAILEALAEAGCSIFENPGRSAKHTNPFYAACMLALLGALLGLLGTLILPHPLFHQRPFPGISLVLAPLGAGFLMHLLGAWRRKKGGHPTSLATFWGGACFAFGMALVRWLITTHS